MNRTIKSIAILGSGVMGSRIACHFANIGVQVLLMDIVPKELTPEETAKKLTLEHPAVKNRIVNAALQSTLKSNPSPIFKKEFASRIRTGNFVDNMKEISAFDWVMEVVVENLDIKKKIFEEVEKYRKPGTLITSNTSSIPIHLMNEGRSDDFKRHFCGTHFFNPPRYLRLLEIIPTLHTDKSVIDFLMHYGDLFLGKQTVLCKDTPAFIANRVGVFAIMRIFQLMQELDLNVDQIDALTGPIIGRPKSATFRTSDVVGLDTLVKVARFVHDSCPDDEARAAFAIPDYLEQMVKNNWLGDKTGQGFYKKTKDANGKTEILTLNLKTLEYQSKTKTKYPTIDAARATDDLKERMRIVLKGNDIAAEFYRKLFYSLFAYVSNRIPEIADEIFRIDDALCAGFGWDIGPFASWDAIGLTESVSSIEHEGFTLNDWVKELVKH